MRKLFAGCVAVATCVSCAASAAEYAPLNCAQASSPSERTICKSYELGQKEARMATLYGVATALVAMGQRGAIQDKQRVWLKKREECGRRVGCLNERYNARIRQLNSVIDSIASRGPY